MNSMHWDRYGKNRPDHQHDDCKCEEYHHRCYDNCQQSCHSHPYHYDGNCCNNFSRCNNGNLGPLAITLAAPTLSQMLNLTIANITTNICDSHFSSHAINFNGTLIIQSTVVPANATLVFTLFKICSGNGFRQPISTFTSTSSLVTANVPQTQSLNFQASSCLSSCDSCCTYYLELTTVSANIATTLNFSISGMICVQPSQGCC
ncbi:DUF4489 domain-containing protein [Clostridium arbusti]|uniref:DUF4489 domain-containing protein n=1 Tax=Clostridium arbusti TaxID=1137848 RepID=UPI000289A7D3|nr:DUF4489 domain-containing protein [Clostridium arbusti]